MRRRSRSSPIVRRFALTARLICARIVAFAGRRARAVTTAAVPRRSASALARSVRRAAGHDQAVLRRVSQRSREDRRRQLRRTHAGEHRPACRRVREGRAQAARPRHAAARRAAARRRGRRLAGRLARRLARPRGRPGASAGSGRAAPAQSQGIRERGSRSPRGRHRRERAAAGRRHRRGLRQHRGGAAGVAVVHRAIRHRRARRRREGGRPAGCAARRLDVPRGTRHAAHARRRPSARHARRHSRESRSPVGRRIPSSTSPTWPPTSGATAWSSRTRWW